MQQAEKERLFKTKRKIALFSMIVNASLASVKFAGGLFSHSSALIADAIHSLSDLAAAFSVFIGINISNRKSKAFPYGLYKVENLVALVSAFAIFLAGYEIAREVLFQKPKEIKSLPVALAVILVTITITFLFSMYEKKMGKKLNSPSLIADAEHVKTDMFSSIIVLIGVIAQYFNIIWLEKVAVLFVVLLIFHSGFEILKESLKVLLDASIDSGTLQAVRKLLENEDLVVKINSIVGRNSGSYIFLELDLDLNTNTLEEAHEFSEYIEKKIKEQIPFVEKVIVHYAHAHKQIKIAVLTEEDGSLCSHFGACPKVVIFTKTQEGFDKQILDNPAANLSRRKGVELVNFLKQQEIACLVLRTAPESETVRLMLKSLFIDVIITGANHIDEIDLEKINCH